MKTKKNMKVAMTFFMVVFLLMLSAGVSFAATASLYDSGSGTTTASSGNSIFATSNGTFTIDANNTIIQLGKLRPFKVISLNIDSVTLPSGVTFGQAADNSDGTVDGHTYQIFARVSNDPDNISSGKRIPLNNPTKYSSSTTPWNVYWVPEPVAYTRFEVDSGASPIIGMTVNFTAFDVDYESTLVTFDTQTTSIGASGVSNEFVAETSGGTGFYTPEGAEVFGFFSNGNDVPYSTDDSEATTSGYYFPDGKEKILPLGEVKRLGLGSDGAATLKMTPYNRRPY